MNVWVFSSIHQGWGSKGQGKVQFLCHPKLQDFDEYISILNAEQK